MQLNFTQPNFQKLSSIHKTWLLYKRAGYNLLFGSSMYLIPFAKSLKYTHTLQNYLIFRFYFAILVSETFTVTPDFLFDVITSFGAYE